MSKVEAPYLEASIWASALVALHDPGANPRLNTCIAEVRRGRRIEP